MRLYPRNRRQVHSEVIQNIPTLVFSIPKVRAHNPDLSQFS